jgi:DNA polymerase-4
MLHEAVGSLAEWLQQLASGIDDRPVIAEWEPKSSGSENTFAQDLTDPSEIRREVASMGRDAAGWLTRKALYARTVTIKVRYSDFTTITRSHTEAPTRDEENIAARAVALLDKTEAGPRPVRLLGVSVHNLVETLEIPEEPAQPSLPFES